MAMRSRREQVLESASKAKLLHPFRSQWNYSNVCFLAAGWATAAVDGASWHDQIRERLFEPLGMSSTNSTYADAIADPGMSKGYMWDEAAGELKYQPIRSVDPVAPAGSVNSSAVDMAEWVRLLLGKGTIDGRELVSEASIETTWTEHSEIWEWCWLWTGLDDSRVGGSACDRACWRH